MLTTIMSWYEFKLFLLEVVLLLGCGYLGASIIQQLKGGYIMNNTKGNKKVRVVVSCGVIGLFFGLRWIFKQFI